MQSVTIPETSQTGILEAAVKITKLEEKQEQLEKDKQQFKSAQVCTEKAIGDDFWLYLLLLYFFIVHFFWMFFLIGTHSSNFRFISRRWKSRKRWTQLRKRSLL